MMIDQVLTFTIPGAYALLPAPMRSDRATAMLIAIGLQESLFLDRVQVNGPARGFWQFELGGQEGGGVKGVMRHPATRDAALAAIEALRYGRSKLTPSAQSHIIYDAIAHNDTLACCFARLLLWTLPTSLPGPDDAVLAWGQYTAAWRPGKPRRETWNHLYAEAWARVRAAQS